MLFWHANMTFSIKMTTLIVWRTTLSPFPRTPTLTTETWMSPQTTVSRYGIICSHINRSPWHRHHPWKTRDLLTWMTLLKDLLATQPPLQETLSKLRFMSLSIRLQGKSLLRLALQILSITTTLNSLALGPWMLRHAGWWLTLSPLWLAWLLLLPFLIIRLVITLLLLERLPISRNTDRIKGEDQIESLLLTTSLCFLLPWILSVTVMHPLFINRTRQQKPFQGHLRFSCNIKSMGEETLNTLTTTTLRVMGLWIITRSQLLPVLSRVIRVLSLKIRSRVRSKQMPRPSFLCQILRQTHLRSFEGMKWWEERHPTPLISPNRDAAPFPKTTHNITDDHHFNHFSDQRCLIIIRLLSSWTYETIENKKGRSLKGDLFWFCCFIAIVLSYNVSY